MRVSTNKYRFFLILLLIMALGGGLWYCYHMYDSGNEPQNGTLVKQQAESEAGNAADHLS